MFKFLNAIIDLFSVVKYTFSYLLWSSYLCKVFFALLKIGLQILEAIPGARMVINKCTIALSSMTLPA